MELTRQLLQQKISLLESSTNDDMADFTLYAARAAGVYGPGGEHGKKALPYR